MTLTINTQTHIYLSTFYYKIKHKSWQRWLFNPTVELLALSVLFGATFVQMHQFSDPGQTQT